MAGSKRRSVSGREGGLLNRMFGSSPKDGETVLDSNTTTQTQTKPANITVPDGTAEGNEKNDDVPDSPRGRKSDDVKDTPTTTDKRSRRASGIKDIFASAKNSFSASPTRPTHDRMSTTQRLGRTDPALNVPQGALNNAAGDSHPSPRSSFRVGVTEDKNKKCRRTMEDTHAYLYNFLSTPAPALHSEGSTMSRTTTAESQLSMQRSTSNPMVETDNGYFAIFDGHAGTFAAEWCGKKLHIILEDVIKKYPNRPIPELLDETFTMVDQQLEKLPLKNSGCTAVTAVLRWEDRIPNPQSATGSTAIAPAAAAAVASTTSTSNIPAQHLEPSGNATEIKLREAASRQRVLYTANVGDARVVLCRSGKALRLSYDHKGSDDNEGKRVANAGGLILNNRVNGVLAVTRALGDAYMKDLVTGHPYTTETVIQPEVDEFMILACDGVSLTSHHFFKTPLTTSQLWDVCSDQEAVDLVRNMQDPQAASKALVDHALSRFSTDNLSCMFVRFIQPVVQAAVEARSEPIGVEGDAASTVRGGVSEAQAIVQAAKNGVAPESTSDLGRVDTNDMILEEDQEVG